MHVVLVNQVWTNSTIYLVLVTLTSFIWLVKANDFFSECILESCYFVQCILATVTILGIYFHESMVVIFSASIYLTLTYISWSIDLTNCQLETCKLVLKQIVKT